MYDRDSFFDLSLVGQVGLACLSVAMFLALILVAHRTLRQRSVWLRVLGSMFLFWLFVWLSPQVYYMYYRVLIPDLPLQWVIKPPLNPLRIVELLSFQGRQTLAAHGQGVLGWCMFAAPFLRWPFGVRGSTSAN